MVNDEAYKSWLVRRTAAHPVPALMRQQRYEFLRFRLGLDTGATVLDVGSGHGFSAGTTWARTVRLDIDEALLRHAGEGVRVVGNANTLPFADQSFDVVTFWEVVHHLAKPVPALREALRVGRYVAIFEPNKAQPAVWALAWITAHRELLWPSHRLEVSLRAAGATWVDIRRGGWIFPNATPPWALPVLRHLPYRWPGGISLIALATRGSHVRNPRARVGTSYEYL